MLHAGREKAHLVQQTGIYKLTDIYENRYNEKKKKKALIKVNIQPKSNLT